MPREQRDDNPEFKHLVRALLKKLGKDFEKCEQCLSMIPKGKYTIHHTKYEGATIYDLQIVCMRCNLQTENKNLM